MDNSEGYINYMRRLSTKDLEEQYEFIYPGDKIRCKLGPKTYRALLLVKLTQRQTSLSN